jgi:hypothetical protein
MICFEFFAKFHRKNSRAKMQILPFVGELLTELFFAKRVSKSASVCKRGQQIGVKLQKIVSNIASNEKVTQYC